MSPKQFNAALEKLGFTQLSFAATLQVNARTVRNWVGGRSVVPVTVAMLLNLMLKTKSTAEDLKS